MANLEQLRAPVPLDDGQFPPCLKMVYPRVPQQDDTQFVYAAHFLLNRLDTRSPNFAFVGAIIPVLMGSRVPILSIEIVVDNKGWKEVENALGSTIVDNRVDIPGSAVTLCIWKAESRGYPKLIQLGSTFGLEATWRNMEIHGRCLPVLLPKLELGQLLHNFDRTDFTNIPILCALYRMFRSGDKFHDFGNDRHDTDSLPLVFEEWKQWAEPAGIRTDMLHNLWQGVFEDRGGSRHSEMLATGYYIY